MPSSSKKQHNFMAAIANNPAFAKKAGIPQAVGEDYMSADKGLKFGKGSTTSRADLQKINKPETRHGNMALFAKGGDMATMNPGFMAMIAKKKGMQEGSKADMASDKKQMMGMKKGGMKKMAEGGMTDMKQDKAMMQKAVNKHEGRLHKGATMTKLATGGSFRSSADGVAQRGKTEARKVTMKRGGKC